VSTDARGKWRIVNFAVALLGLIAVVGFAWLRRRSVLPIISKEA
jgi:MYXO-CTERM domain-containing protein